MQIFLILNNMDGILRFKSFGPIKETLEYHDSVIDEVNLDWFAFDFKISQDLNDLYLSTPMFMGSLSTKGIDFSRLLKENDIIVPQEYIGPRVSDMISIESFARTNKNGANQLLIIAQNMLSNPSYIQAQIIAPEGKDFYLMRYGPRFADRLIWMPSDRGYSLVASGQDPIKVSLKRWSERMAKKSERDLEGLKQFRFAI